MNKETEVNTKQSNDNSCDCQDKTQCWEPCGDLGHDEKYVEVSNEKIGDPQSYTEKLEQELSELKAKYNSNLSVLSDISSMCIGELAMSYKLDAQEIGNMIYKSTGLTEPELRKVVSNVTKEKSEKGNTEPCTKCHNPMKEWKIVCPHCNHIN